MLNFILAGMALWVLAGVALVCLSYFGKSGEDVRKDVIAAMLELESLEGLYLSCPAKTADRIILCLAAAVYVAVWPMSVAPILKNMIVNFFKNRGK